MGGIRPHPHGQRMTPAQQKPDLADGVSQVEVACPNCGTPYRVAAGLVGRKFQCRKCQNVWRWKSIPPPGKTSASPSPRQQSDTHLTEIGKSGGLPTAGDAPSAILDMSWTNKRLGRYTLTTLLGRGGMGVVWRAHDPSLKREIAIKILTQPANGSSSTLGRALFLQEARAAAKLNHPGAITVFEIAEDGGHAFIAMELMHGGTLKDRVDRTGPIDPRDAFLMLINPAKALALGHARGIIHRDVKPGNLMFDDHGHLKLGDFGLSDVAGDPASASLRGKSVGSLGWVAPETARGESTTALSDIYAFGLVLLYAITGRQWLTADNRSALLQLHQNPPEPDFSNIPELTDDGRALLGRCLARNPADRFQSADEMATFLEHCAHEPSPADLAAMAAPAGSQFKILAVSLTTAIAAIVLTLLATFGYLTKSESHNKAPLRSISRPTPSTPVFPGTTTTESDDPESRFWPGKIDENGLRYIASRSGTVYHTPACDGGRKIYLSNLVRYDTPEEAEAAGKTPCPHCRPDLSTLQPVPATRD